MKCLTYAHRKQLEKGGYICFRECNSVDGMPHFLHAESLNGVSHMAGTTDHHWTIVIALTILGIFYSKKTYEERFEDDKYSNKGNTL